MRKIAVLFVLAAVCVLGNSNSAHSNAFLFLPEIPGESTDNSYREWINVFNWSWQASNAGPSTPSLVRPLIITKLIDKSSPFLVLNVLTVQHIPEAILAVTTMSTSGMYEYLRITMENVVITNIHDDFSVGNERAFESVALTFGRICYQYTPVDSSGGISSPFVKCFDVESSREI